MNKILNLIKAQFPKDKPTLIREIKSYIMVTLACAAYSFALVAFIINPKIVSGGVNGVCTLIYYASNNLIPVAYSSLAINAVLLIIGIKILGNSFGIKTIYAIFVLSIFIGIAQKLITEPIMGDDKFLSAVIAGAIIGISVGTAFNFGGSTGGTDIIALILTKYRNVSPGRIILYCDICIISSSYIVFHYFLGKTPVESIRTVVYGFVVMGVCSYTIDLIVLGSRQSVQLLISSKMHEQIAEMITKELNRGATMLHGQGCYTKEEVEVLLVVVRKNEIQSLLRRVHEIDHSAFTSITNASGVYGQGFDHLKK